jgi:outer membrane protein
MKKTITVICLLFTVTVGYVKAQTSAGNMMVGGGFSIESESQQSNSDVGSSSVTFTPNFGYFIADGFALGLSLNIGSSTVDEGADKTKYSTLAVGPYARYYKFTSNENFAFFGQATFLVGSTNVDVTPGGERKGSFVQFAISPGFSYFFNKHWALDLQLQGLVVTSEDPNKDNDDDKYSSVSFGLNSFNPTLGFRYHFGGN